jgi:hypothetical protein
VPRLAFKPVERFVSDTLPNYWPLALNQFAILYEDRFTVPNA